MNDSSSTDSVTAVSDTTLDAHVINTIFNTSDRLTPLELKRRVQHACRPVKHGQIESSIKRLVEQKELIYTYQFGNSFLEPSFEKPVRVANSIILKPPACDYLSGPEVLPGDVVINIQAGAAFGTGFHPTTRLSLQALEFVCRPFPQPELKDRTHLLDIGTGSGVLVIAGIRLGFDHGIGIDIDPCSRVEALENVKLNNLAEKIEISGDSLDAITGNFSIVIANLRLPTLKDYFTRMVELLDTNGYLIMSGIKTDEIEPLKMVSAKNGMAVFWEGIEKGWAGLVFEPASGFEKR